MLHLQLDVALINGTRQEHYMFYAGFSWSLSSSVKSFSRKVSVYRVPVVMEILESYGLESVYFWAGIVKLARKFCG